MRIVKQNRFKNLGELHKEWTEAGATTHRRFSISNECRPVTLLLLLLGLLFLLDDFY